MQLNSNEIARTCCPTATPSRWWTASPMGSRDSGQRASSASASESPYFCGHFPQKHVMPGVLILEAMAQVGAVAILSLPENQGKIALFGGVKNARFKPQGDRRGTCWSWSAPSPGAGGRWASAPAGPPSTARRPARRS